jgi:hypothetical protein
MTSENDNETGEELIFQRSGCFYLVRPGHAGSSARVKTITKQEAADFLLSKVRQLPQELEPANGETG